MSLAERLAALLYLADVDHFGHRGFAPPWGRAEPHTRERWLRAADIVILAVQGAP